MNNHTSAVLHSTDHDSNSNATEVRVLHVLKSTYQTWHALASSIVHSKTKIYKVCVCFIYILASQLKWEVIYSGICCVFLECTVSLSTQDPFPLLFFRTFHIISYLGRSDCHHEATVIGSKIRSYPSNFCAAPFTI